MAENKVGIVPKFLNIIGLSAFFLCVFFGLLYVLHGNVILGSFLSLLLLVIIWVLSNSLTNQKTKTDNDKSILYEIIIGSIYFIIFLVSFPICFHFIDVDFNRKETIAKTGINNLEICNNIIKQYYVEIDHKKTSLQTEIETARDIYFANMQNKNAYTNLIKLVGQTFDNNSTDKQKVKSQIDKVIKDKLSKLDIKYNIDDPKAKFDNYFNEAKPIFSDWQRLKISEYYYGIDSVYNKLIDVTTTKMQGFSFSDKINKEMNMDDMKTTIAKSPVTEILLMFALFVVMHICIIAPYIAAPRHTGNTPGKRLGKDVVVGGDISNRI